MVTKQDETVNGPTCYRDNFGSGWSECREYFAHDVRFEGQTLWDAGADNGMAPWNLIHAPAHVIDAYCDGWRDCERQIDALLETTTPDTLRARLMISQQPYRWALYIAGAILLVGALLLARASYQTAFSATCTPANWINRFFSNQHTLYNERRMLDNALDRADDEP